MHLYDFQLLDKSINFYLKILHHFMVNNYLDKDIQYVENSVQDAIDYLDLKKKKEEAEKDKNKGKVDNEFRG